MEMFHGDTDFIFQQEYVWFRDNTAAVLYLPAKSPLPGPRKVSMGIVKIERH